MSIGALRIVAAAGATALLLVLAGCGGPGTIAPDSAAAPAGAGLPSPHVHGVAVNPGDTRVYLATHHGLFRYGTSGPERVGPVIDLMGFTVAGPDHFLASGHPGAGTDIPEPVGLIESRDAGATWATLSRAGQSDFHALTASTLGVLGFDGALRSSVDGVTWSELSIPGPPQTLAASPNGRTVLATSAVGVLRSEDGGRTWAAAHGAPELLVVTWADSATAVGVSVTGAVHVSADAGGTWKAGGVAGRPQAVGAARTAAGGLRILVATHSAVLESTDNGTSFVPVI